MKNYFALTLTLVLFSLPLLAASHHTRHVTDHPDGTRQFEWYCVVGDGEMYTPNWTTVHFTGRDDQDTSHFSTKPSMPWDDDPRWTYVDGNRYTILQHAWGEVVWQGPGEFTVADIYVSWDFAYLMGYTDAGDPGKQRWSGDEELEIFAAMLETGELPPWAKDADVIWVNEPLNDGTTQLPPVDCDEYYDSFFPCWSATIADPRYVSRWDLDQSGWIDNADRGYSLVMLDDYCSGDVNNDHRVDQLDLGLLLNWYGFVGDGGSWHADVTGDWVVDQQDLTAVLKFYGQGAD